MIEEPAQPNTLAQTLATDRVHSVVPIPAADQRQTVTSERECPFDRTNAMIINIADLFGNDGNRNEFVAVRAEQFPLDVRDFFAKD